MQPLQRVVERPRFPGGPSRLGCGHEPVDPEPGPVGPFAYCPECPDAADLPPLPDPEPSRVPSQSIRAAIEDAQARSVPADGQETLPGLSPPRRAVDAPSAPVGRDLPVTAHRAAARALPASGTRRRAVYGLLVEALPDGHTDEEIENHLGVKHQSVSAARRSLVLDGWVADSGRKRLLANGNEAIVWVATP